MPHHHHDHLHDTSPTAMAASGMLFLGKRGAKPNRTASGDFFLLLFAHDRISAHRLEPWLLRWEGKEAEAFWSKHAPHLQPGQPLQVTATRLRTFNTSNTSNTANGLSPEVHATVLACALAPLHRATGRRRSPPASHLGAGGPPHHHA